MTYLLVVIGIFSCSLSQLLLKRSANKQYRSKMYELLNPLVMLAYFVFFCSLLVNIWAMGNGVELKEMAVLETLSFIFVPLLSFFVLKEKITKRVFFATLIVLLGIFVFYL